MKRRLKKFIKKEYWSIHLDTQKEDSKFSTKLVTLENNKVEQFTVTNEAQQKEIVGELILKSAGKTIVSRVDKKQRTRKPPSPFTTSTMQQEGVREIRIYNQTNHDNCTATL